MKPFFTNLISSSIYGFLLIGSILCSSTPTFAQLCNTLTHHDFEELDYAQTWIGNDGVNGEPSGLSRTDSAVISGTYAAKLEVAGQGAVLSNKLSPFELSAGKFYSLDYWIRSSDTATVYYAVAQNGTLNFNFLDSVEVLPGWQEVHREFQATQDLTNAIVVLSPGYVAARGPYDLFLDFFTLCEQEQTDTCNEVTMAGFESLAYTAAWTHYDGGSPGSSYLFLSDENVYEKRFSAELRVNFFGGAGAYITSATRAMFPMDSLANYTFSCWMRSNVDSARIEALVNRRTPYRELGTRFFILDTVWRKYTMSFQSSVNAPQAYVRFIAKNAYLTQPYSIYIDQIRLCKTDAPPQESPGGISEGLMFWTKANDGPNGRSVRTWSDRSGIGYDMLARGTVPLRRIDQVNQNETVNFNSVNDRLVSQAIDLTNKANDHAWYVVLKGNNPNPGSVPLAFYADGYRLQVGQGGQYELAGIKPVQTLSVPADVNTWNIISANSDNMNFGMYINGRADAPINQLGALEEADSTLFGARALDNSDWWNGDLAEVIVYKKHQTNEERRNVFTYLALKYGISIPVNQHVYYSHTSHPNLISGIGQSQESMGLRQTRSRNIQPGSVVTISRPTRLDDGDFLVWGHDNGSLTASGNAPNGVVSRITRTWKVSHTGNLGKVMVSFDLGEIGWVPGYNYELLIDKDGDFSNAERISEPYLNGNEIGFPGVRLEDGDFFSLAMVGTGTTPKAPGNIDDGLSLWLQAERGPNSNSLSTWEDLSPMSNTATAFDEGPRREWDQINGNPAIDFLINRNVMIGASELHLSADAHTYYLVLNSTGTRNWSNPFTARENGYRLEVNGNTRNYSIYGLEPGSINSTAPTASWSMMGVSAASDRYIMFQNGEENSSRTVRDGLQGNGPYFVGARNRNFSAWYSGKIAELIVYGKEQDATTRNAVETYLSVKYGITIPVASHLYYTQDTHTRAIAGIGRDSRQWLNQRNSKSIDSTAILRISNPSGLGEQEYLIWGHDGSDLDRNNNVPPNVNMRVNRTWRVSRTGNPGSVWVEFELAGLGVDLSDPGEFALLIDSDKDFSDARVINNGALIGSKIEFKGVQFSDGDMFSLAIADMATSREEELPSELLHWNVFPNPGNELLNLSFETRIPTQLQLGIYDFQGRQIHSMPLQSFGTRHAAQIHTGLWAKGLYFLRLTEGEAVISRTWMKQ